MKICKHVSLDGVQGTMHLALTKKTGRRCDLNGGLRVVTWSYVANYSSVFVLPTRHHLAADFPLILSRIFGSILPSALTSLAHYSNLYLTAVKVGISNESWGQMISLEVFFRTMSPMSLQHLDKMQIYSNGGTTLRQR